MKFCDKYGNFVNLSVGSRVIDANDASSVKKLISVPSVRNLIDSMGNLENAGSQFGVGNELKIYPRSGIKELRRDGETIVVCKQIIPILKQTNKGKFSQYGVIYCDLYKGDKQFLIYTINEDGFQYYFSRYCAIKDYGRDIINNNNKISVIPVFEEKGRSYKR